MADKKTYLIDEGALRQKLLSYSVSFNSEVVAALENEISHIKTGASFELPERRVLVKFVALPIIVVAFAVVAYFGFNYIKDISKNTSPKKDSTTVINPTIEPKIEVKQDARSKVQETRDKNQDARDKTTLDSNLMYEAKKTEAHPNPSQKEGLYNKALYNKTTTVPKKDTSHLLKTDNGGLDTMKKTIVPPDSSAKNKDGTPKKKKRKKKNADVTEDIRQQNQQPNAADDDVVVPPGN